MNHDRDDEELADAIIDSVPVECPYCGEAVDLMIDEGGGEGQSYVEDCPVCCQPWEVTLVRDPHGGWHAELRTADD
jgi:hypothetical protein